VIKVKCHWLSCSQEYSSYPLEDWGSLSIAVIDSLLINLPA
jgi:hypothetical protein